MFANAATTFIKEAYSIMIFHVEHTYKLASSRRLHFYLPGITTLKMDALLGTGYQSMGAPQIQRINQFLALSDL